MGIDIPAQMVRRRRQRLRGPSGAVEAAHHSVPPPPDESLAGIPALIAEFRAWGLGVQFADRTRGQAVSPGTGRLAFELVRDAMSAAHAQHAPGQTLHTRIRVDGGDLVISTQTFGPTARTSGPTTGDASFAVDAPHRRQLGTRIHAAGGRLSIRQTAAGNWLAIVRLPL